MKTIPYSKFKHGQRVTCEIDGVKIDDAKISIDKDGSIFICQNKICGLITAAKFGYKYSFCICTDNKRTLNDRLTNLKFLQRTLDDLDEGDVIVSNAGERKVLGKCGEVYFLSLRDNFGSAWGTMTISDMKEYKYTLKQEPLEEEEQIQELTLQEIADKMGIPVEKLRIKD